MLFVEILDLFDHFIKQEMYIIKSLDKAIKDCLGNQDQIFQLRTRQADHEEMKHNLEDLKRMYEIKHDR